VSFKNTVIIMTSNAGAQSIVNPKQLGFSKEKDAKKDYEFMKNSVMEEVKRIFKPEFINRIDDIIVFHELTKDEIKSIVKLLLKQLATGVKEGKGITLKFKPSLVDFISEKGYDPKYGARPVKRAIQDNLEDKLADMLLAGEINEGDTVNVTCEKGTVLLQGMR
ncbi:MAG: ATP-dependent Clp protease ATP-binding subunit, partial [Lachnospiraceae bacterium]|nr:ATP-dependent Clp protease ATP-binding subunit [Lachnospiraceae bacterium]